MSTSAPLDTYQQVFALSMLSNRASAFTGPAAALQQQLQYELSSYLTNTGVQYTDQGGFVPADPTKYPIGLIDGIQAYLGDWSLVWGPVVFSSTDANGKPSGVADNAVFIANCPSVNFPGCLDGALNTYVVAIAATNPSSKYDWSVEDFKVSSAVQWTGWQPGNLTPLPKTGLITQAAISLGTAIGVTEVLTLVPPSTAPGSGLTITQFLHQQNPGKQSAVVFTGHSLAGALAPTTALYLQQSGLLSQFGYLLTYPTAGATPGNIAFAGQFNSAFPSPPVDPATGKAWKPLPVAPYQAWNTLLWNCYDVVPHAWFASPVGMSPKLSEIPTLYGSPAMSDINVLKDIAVANSAASDTIYVHTRNQQLNGTLQAGVSIGGLYLATPTPPTKLDQFVGQLYVQHIGMYSGIPASTNIPQCDGVVLQQPVPRPTPPLPPLPGVSTLALNLEAMVKKLEQIIANWLKNHTAT